MPSPPPLRAQPKSYVFFQEKCQCPLGCSAEEPTPWPARDTRKDEEDYLDALYSR